MTLNRKYHPPKPKCVMTIKFTRATTPCRCTPATNGVSSVRYRHLSRRRCMPRPSTYKRRGGDHDNAMAMPPHQLLWLPMAHRGWRNERILNHDALRHFPSSSHIAPHSYISLIMSDDLKCSHMRLYENVINISLRKFIILISQYHTSRRFDWPSAAWYGLRPMALLYQ